ncbi:MAG: NTP transferase domain-containing protein [Sediminibacterium sp.]
MNLQSKSKWHSRELALYGTTCEEIRRWVNYFQLEVNQRLAYVDASHSEGNSDSSFGITTHENYFILQEETGLDQTALQEFDGALVNGNHHAASNQIIFVNLEKEKSLIKRSAELINVLAVVLPEGMTEVPAYVQPFLQPETKIFMLKEEVLQFVSTFFEVSPLKALVLLGGKSSRMGEEKGLIQYHEKTQAEHLVFMLEEIGLDVFLSVREEQKESYAFLNRPFIADQLQGAGPLGGIASAMRTFPQTAFLVVACDLPNLQKEQLGFLLKNRNAKAFATCYESPMDGGPEPLCSIYEPKSFSALMKVWVNGKSCPRKMLFNRTVELLPVLDAIFLANANTPEDRSSWANQ